MEYRIYRENIRVRHREADRNGRLKLLSWFDFLQEAAANHATPVSYTHLRAHET